MPKKDRFAFSASCSFSEKFVAGFARCGFDRDLLFRSEGADIYRAKLNAASAELAKETIFRGG